MTRQGALYHLIILWYYYYALAIAVKAEESHLQSPFLPEILRGRCYDRPVVDDDAHQCPAAVGSLLGAFAGKLEEDVRVEDFQAYLEVADFASRPDSGVLILGDNDDQVVGRVPGLVRPEDTPGGALVAGLSFCANDQLGDCPGVTEPSDDTGEFTGTQSALWAGVYQEFAKRVKGRLVMVLLPFSDETTHNDDDDPSMTLAVHAAIPAFSADSVTQVDIYVMEGECLSSTVVENVRTALTETGVAKDAISCVKDPYLLNLMLCVGTLATKESCQLAHQISQTWAAALATEEDQAASAANLAADQDDDQEYRAEKKTATRLRGVPVTVAIVVMASIAVVFYCYIKRSRIEYDEVPLTAL